MASTAAGRLEVVGRVISVAAAVIAFVVAAWYVYVLMGYALSDGGTWWGGAGILPLVFLARLVVAGCVAWAVVGLDARTMLRVFLAAFGGSFLLLFGWYFAILGYDDPIFYLSVSLIIGSALALAATRPERRNGHLEA